MNKILCFDLDDTLIDDNYKFELTFCKCIETIIQALETRSPQIDDILQIARNHDNLLWESLPADKKYMPDRVATAWMRAYEDIATSKNIPVRDHVKKLLWSLVMTNFDPPYFVIPGVIETLSALKSQDYKLHVLTVGHPDIQKRKLKVSHLMKYFDDYHIVPSNKKEILAKLAEENGKENVVMIGNSMRSDINPALELGLKVVYIPRGSWSKFNEEALNQNYIKLERIDDILNVL